MNQHYYIPYTRGKVFAHYITAQEFTLEEGFDLIQNGGVFQIAHSFKKGDATHEYVLNPKAEAYKRKRLFIKQPFCAKCGLKGTKWILEYNPHCHNYIHVQLMLYSDNGIAMTIDHIKDQAQGGSKKGMYNLQTLCYACNQRKSNNHLNHKVYGFQQNPELRLTPLF